MKKQLSLALALSILLASFASCAQSSEEQESETTAAAPSAETETETEAETNPYYEGYVDPFTEVDFDGATFSVHNSSNVAVSFLVSSAYYIEGPEELTGDVAPDAVFQRNLDVMNRLDVNIEYHDFDYGYGDVAGQIQRLMRSGDAEYDLIINDIYGLAPIAVNGFFHNAYDGSSFDFDAPWWYDDFMRDISINENLRFMLAGDYFIDMIRCTHVLVMNKDLYTDVYGNPEEVYEAVLNNEWTLDKFKSLIENCYVDLNGNGERDKNDQYGHAASEVWGSMIPWLIAADPGFITRDENGYPVIAVNNERSILLTEKLNSIFNNNATGIPYDDSIFFEGRSLFLGYQRLCSLENESLRDAEIDFAVLPYPMLDENQKQYVTSTHDTAELGFIPVLVSEDRLDFVSTVIEVLCRESYTQVIPAYYESSLKIKYARDTSSGQMLDIIHDSYGNGFALAYSNGMNGIFLSNTFKAAIESNSTDFVSRYAKLEKGANKSLNRMIEKCEELLAE